MNKKQEKLETLMGKTGRIATLTSAERTKMRFVLREYAALKPLPHSAPRCEGGALAAALLRARAAFVRPLPFGAALAIVLALTSGGVAYASEGTLPGDLLYPVKVGVTEPARTLLAASPTAKAAWEAMLAVRRIDEGAALAARGDLSAPIEAALVVRFTKSAEAARSIIEAQGKSNPGDASVTALDFAARLAAYETVLAHAKQAHAASSIAVLAQALRVEADAAEEISVRLPASGSAQSASSSQLSAPQASFPFVSRVGTSVDQALQAAADAIGMNAGVLGASTTASAKGELARASAFATQGRNFMKNGDTKEAIGAFRDSLAISARLDVLTHAAAKLNIDAFGETGDRGGSNSSSRRLQLLPAGSDAASHDATEPIQPGGPIILSPSASASERASEKTGASPSSSSESTPLPDDPSPHSLPLGL